MSLGQNASISANILGQVSGASAKVGISLTGTNIDPNSFIPLNLSKFNEIVEADQEGYLYVDDGLKGRRISLKAILDAGNGLSIEKIEYKDHKLAFEFSDGSTFDVDLSDLADDIEVGDGLDVEDGKIVLKVIDDYLYVDKLFGLRTKAQEIADLAKISVNGQSAETKNARIFAPEEGRVANSTQECYVLMPNGTSDAPIWGKFTIDNEPQVDGFNTVFRLNGIEIGSVKHTQEIYLDSVIREGNKIVFSYNTASGKKQVEVDLADLVDVYEAGNGLKRDGNTFSVKIEPNSTDFLEATKDGIVFKKSALPEAGDKIEMLEGATLNFASLPPEIGVITESGIHYFVPEVELELPDGRFVYMQSRNALPITEGEGVEFKKNPNNTVSINAKGGGNKTVTTSAELDKALATEKSGTLISYVGESTGGGSKGTPFEVGDVVSKFYFDINNMFDLTALDYSGFENGELIKLLAVAEGVPILQVQRFDLNEQTSGAFNGCLYMVCFGAGSATVYAWSPDVTPQEVGLPMEEWGWNQEYMEFLSTGVLEYDEYPVYSVSQQEVWGSFFSKTPFTGDGNEYKKDTLYMVTDSGAKQVGGETIKFSKEDKGKFLVVGDDGSIVAETMTIGENMLI